MKAVEFINISKLFGKFPANDDISFAVSENTVHCILGENGAGKSTLMKILFGMDRPDYGKVKIFGEEINFNSPQEAIEKKIGMVHQHFMLVDDFTVLENVVLGNELTKGIKLNITGARQIISGLIAKYNLGLDADMKISDISISGQQKVEILKLLFRESEILIFDEPTAVLSPLEVEEFFKIISEFKNSGKTIILITHKLNEVRRISDRVSVLRRGKLVFEEDNIDNKLDIDKLSKAIVGESDLSQSSVKVKPDKSVENILDLKNIDLYKKDIKVLNGLNLKLNRGEIHGICGVEGNGQNEIVDIITGIETKFTGDYESGSMKISLVPDDRIKKGMIKEFSIGENVLLKDKDANILTGKIIDRKSEKVIKDYDVRVSDKKLKLGSLSGGNQQKVIVAREIELDNDILIFSHPTRGVDISASLFIHSKIIEERNKGKSILVISSDLDELITLSDRLSVLYNGKIIKSFDINENAADSTTEIDIELKHEKYKPFFEQIGKLMIGITN
ncbi:MAG TPA: ABC transporter ATP-binding protein [Ignavibacteria bacterium]|nr:ABC transporter ATP-binding protein [Ignavibacteria bacterium]